MKALFLHCNNFSYNLDHPTKIAVEATQENFSAENVLAIFLSVENGDDDSKVSLLIQEIQKFSDKNMINSVLINPFAHLGGDLAKPDYAKNLLKILSERFGVLKQPTHLAPFGWYKGFSMNVFGHNESQFYREF